MTDLEAITRPGGIVPVDIETTGTLVREVLRLRAALQRIQLLGETHGDVMVAIAKEALKQ